MNYFQKKISPAIIQHRYKSINEAVYKSDSISEGVQRMSTYLNNFEQSNTQYHMLYINGKRIEDFEAIKRHYYVVPKRNQ